MESDKSLGALLRRSCAKWDGKTAMLMPERNGFTALSYAELYKVVERYAAALHDLGIQKGDRFVILSDNCPEWAFADWAGQTLGAIVVPIYPTLPSDQAQYIVKDCGAKLVLAGSQEQLRKVHDMQGVQAVLLKGEPGSLEQLSEQAGLNPLAWETNIEAVQPDDVATIIYTSGTTGLPKGAMLTHRSLTWIGPAVLHTLPINDKDTFLCFLPMSHVFERVDGQILPISIGATIGFAKSLKTLASDMLAVRPTVMLCVPRFMEATREKILDGVAKQSGLHRKMFELALSQGTRRFKGQFAPLFPLTDKLVGAKVRARLGGRIRFFASGGAALPAFVAEFYGAFNVMILQGYGLTESASGVVINHPERNKYWTVGEPLPGIECKIAEDGEILLRGTAMMIGYYNLPEETAAALDSEGWFHTGDIGEWEGDHLRITDRKKDLLVLGNGKNIAPQPIENKLRASNLIQEAVVLGDGMEYCCALIVPQFEAVREAAHLPPSALLSESPEARAMIKKEIDAVNKTLANFELVKKFAILDQPFSIESGEMTPTLKVRRKVVKEKYATVIRSLQNG